MKRLFLFILILSTVFLTACGERIDSGTKYESTYNTSAEGEHHEEKTEQEPTTKNPNYPTVVNSLPERVPFMTRKPELETHRNMLSPELQVIYDEYWEKISNYEIFVADFASDGYGYEDFYKVTDAIRADYTETRLFLETSELYSDEMYKGQVRYISVGYDYNWIIRDSFDCAFMDSYIEDINSVCDEIISRMPDGTNAEKYEFLGREIIGMTYYGENDDAAEVEDVDWSYAYMNGPLLYGKAICQGYSYAYMYLCNRAGLWCHTTSGGGHCWNIVKLENGSTYHVDLTWADTDESEIYDDVFYRYFLLSQEEIEVDHSFYEGEMTATGEPIEK